MERWRSGRPVLLERFSPAVFPGIGWTADRTSRLRSPEATIVYRRRTISGDTTATAEGSSTEIGRPSTLIFVKCWLVTPCPCRYYPPTASSSSSCSTRESRSIERRCRSPLASAVPCSSQVRSASFAEPPPSEFVDCAVASGCSMLNTSYPTRSGKASA